MGGTWVPFFLGAHAPTCSTTTRVCIFQILGTHLHCIGCAAIRGVFHFSFLLGVGFPTWLFHLELGSKYKDLLDSIHSWPCMHEHLLSYQIIVLRYIHTVFVQ